MFVFVCLQALSDLENSSKDLAADLKDLYISSVKEVEVGAGKKALLVFVPFRLHKKFQKINSRIVRELEKKFANKHVLFIAQRTIMSKSVRHFRRFCHFLVQVFNAWKCQPVHVDLCG